MLVSVPEEPALSHVEVLCGKGGVLGQGRNLSLGIMGLESIPAAGLGTMG